MKVAPSCDRVLLRRTEEQEVKRGQIFIPDTAKKKTLEAEVVAAGSGCIFDDGKVIQLTVKKGG